MRDDLPNGRLALVSLLTGLSAVATVAAALARLSGSHSPFDHVILVAGVLMLLQLALSVHLMRKSKQDRDELQNANRELKHEIEQRRETERQFQERNACLNALVATSPLAIVVQEPNGTVVTVNPAFERIFGRRAADVLGRRLDDFVASPELSEEANALSQRVLSGENIHVVTKRARADGTPVDVEIFGAPLMIKGHVISAYAIYQDITERKQAEEALRTSETELRALFSAMSDLIFVLDGEGRYKRVAPTNPSLLYLPAAQLIGKTLHEVLPRRQADEFLRVIRKALDTQKTVNVEYDLKIDGADHWFSARVSPLKDTVLIVARDITERKQTEEDLARQRDLLQALMNSMPDRIFFKDKQSRFTRINLAHARSFNLASPEDALGKTDFDFRAETDAERYFAEEQQIIRTGQPLIGQIQRSVQRDGAMRYSSVTKVPILGEDGKPAGIVGISRDITDWIKAKEALLESETRYRILFQQSPYPMFVYDKQTLAFLAVNEAAVTHYGYSLDEFLGMTIKDIRPPEDLPRLMEILDNLHEDGGQFMARHRKKDGTNIDVEVTAHPLVFAGRPARVVVASDVTEKRQLEDRLRQSQKMEAVGRLAGGVAHDFNNLLTVIIGYGDLLAQRLRQDDRARVAVEEIQKAADRGASLTRQLLAFSRRQVLQPKVLDLNTVIAGTEKMLRRLIGEDVELATVLDPGLGWVKADPGQVEQVLLNLAVNARDAMPNGGRLTLESRNVELDQTYAAKHVSVQPGSYVMLAVSDTGHGMSPEVLAHLFEPFFTTKEVGKGTGLGLATVYGIVKQSGGYVWVYSEPGQGTTLKIYLPRIDRPASQAQPVQPLDGDFARGSETVLLAEDEDVVRRLVGEVLERNGYKVLITRSGQEALDTCANHPGPIDLLITDVIMPGMNGRELAQQVVRIRREARVLFMSGYTDDGIVKQGMLEAGSVFIQKPFTAELLARKVREALDSRPQQADSAHAAN